MHIVGLTLLLWLANPGTHYRAEEVKAVTTFIKKHYGRKDSMATFTAERKAILEEQAQRAEEDLRCEGWASHAFHVFERARASELSATKETRREAYVFGPSLVIWHLITQ